MALTKKAQIDGAVTKNVYKSPRRGTPAMEELRVLADRTLEEVCDEELLGISLARFVVTDNKGADINNVALMTSGNTGILVNFSRGLDPVFFEQEIAQMNYDFQFFWRSKYMEDDLEGEPTGPEGLSIGMPSGLTIKTDKSFDEIQAVKPVSVPAPAPAAAAGAPRKRN